MPFLIEFVMFFEESVIPYFTASAIILIMINTNPAEKPKRMMIDSTPLLGDPEALRARSD